MADTVDELDFLIEHRERTIAFEEAKANAESNPEAWREEKNRMREWRQHWREVRAAFAVEPDEGDAVASPEPLSMGVTPQEVN